MMQLSASILEVAHVHPDGTANLASDPPASDWPRKPPFRGGSADPDLWKKARACGLSRARSASPAVWLAICAAAAVKDVVSTGDVAVCVVSTTATEAVALRFEQTGIREGWKLADPFWLPNTIPSGCPTSVVAALGLRGTALGFPGTVQGFFAALDHSLMALNQRRCERALVVVAEDNGWLLPVMSLRGLQTIPRSGAFAIVLGSVGPNGDRIVRNTSACFDAALGTRDDSASAWKPVDAEAYEADAPADLLFAFKAGRPDQESAEFVFASGDERLSLRLERDR